MKSRRVGLRVALFGILALVLGGTMAMTGNVGGFAPSEAVAAEKVGVPVVSKAVVPAGVRASFARPELGAMKMRAFLNSMRKGGSPFATPPALDATLMRTRLGSLEAMDDPIPSGYDSVEGAEYVYYAGSNSWYVDTYYLWELIKDNLQYWPYGSYVEWSWAIQDEYENDLGWCHGFQTPLSEYHPCAQDGYVSPGNYECVGNEWFTTGIVVHYLDSQWVWQYMDWYYNYDLGGC